VAFRAATRLSWPAPASEGMDCEFCNETLPQVEPENMALLLHVQESEPCNEQFEYLLENLRSSWTPNMSGG
jgi:hypothetical protein